MQIDLNRLGTAGEHLDAVEQALDEQAFSSARAALDLADLELEAAHQQWRESDGPARALLGTMGKTVGERRNALAARIPKPATLSEGAPEPDADGDEEDLAA
jgi:hypothetical protein